MSYQRMRKALDHAWSSAEGAEAADAAGQYGDRDTRIALAGMWAQVATAEAAATEAERGRVNDGCTDQVRPVRNG